jgi:uncharacterized membrane protein
MLAFADERRVVVRMERGIGEFATRGAPLLSLASRDPIALDARVIDAANRLFQLGHFRTIEQDVEFGMRQLVDIALKALSPAVNDTTTAIVAIDYASTVLAAFANRRVEHRRRSARGELRVIARGASFESLLGGAFEQILGEARANTAISLRLLSACGAIAVQTRSARRRALLREWADRCAAQGERCARSERERERIRARRAWVGAALEGPTRVDELGPPAAAPGPR